MIAATAALSSCLPNTRANAKDRGDPSCNGLEEATLSARTTSSALRLVMALGTWPQVLLGKLVPSALPPHPFLADGDWDYGSPAWLQ